MTQREVIEYIIKSICHINILGITELKWTKMGELNSDDHYTCYCGQESLRRNGVAIIVNKRVQNAVLGYNLKNDKMISVGFQGKPFNITVIQVYAPMNNAEEVKVDWFYEDLQDLLELIPKKRCPFHHRGLQCKSRKSSSIWSNRQAFGLGVQNEAEQRLKQFCQETHWPQQISSSNNTRDDSTHGHHQMVNTEIRLIIFFKAEDGEALYSKQKQDLELTVAQIISSLLQNSGLN